ncbi:MAG: type I restriction endonuclease subunit R, partial [Chloroflexota bacterium]|nr:type I restriction endonuclease subunit R [Chloroflexota bacterium]
RVEVQTAIDIALTDENTEIDPVPTAGGGYLPEPELDLLSNIVKSFNDQWGNIDWKDVDKIRDVITNELPAKVAADTAYQNAIANSGRANARIEHDKALQRAIFELLSDHTELFKHYSDDPNFKKWLTDYVFSATYHAPE